MWLCVYICVHTCSCRSQRSILGAFLYLLSTYNFLRQDVLLNLRVINLARPAGEPSLVLCLFLPPYYWGYRHGSLKRVLGLELQSLFINRKHFNPLNTAITLISLDLRQFLFVESLVSNDIKIWLGLFCILGRRHSCWSLSEIWRWALHTSL